jgi:signal transduction histidine kinase
MPHPGRPHAHEWGDARFARWPDDVSRARSVGSAKVRLVVPVVVSFGIQVPAALFWALYRHDLTVWGLVSILLAVVGPLLLFAARAYPGPVVALVSAAACLDFLVADPDAGPPYIALAFAIGSAIVRGARLWAWLSVGVVWVGTVTVGAVFGLDWHPARIAITTLGILIVFGVAEAIRTRRENFEKYRGVLVQRRQTEVQAERVRIARELHDVLAHSLSQINVQAGVGLHLMDKQPDKAAEALASIKETSKTALDEVRTVLGMLRADGGQDPSAPLVPEPDLSRLPGLAASVTSQGVEVTLRCEVTGAPKAVQLAIYRIVQESLTNVVRHAGATAATVVVDERGEDVIVTITDNGSGLIEGTYDGRGLLGMRERTELLGGSLELDGAPEGGLRVTARLPKEHQ